jgi:diguanylate cyclase
MHYQHSRAQSAEILRLALALMGRQRAGFQPTSYTLWYEHASGVNPQLSQVLDARLARGELLTDEHVVELYAQYIATREGDTLERIKRRLLALLQETSDLVSSTGTHALQFSETLEGQSRRLSEPVSLDSIREVVRELFTETQHMCAANVGLTRQLQTSLQEVESLTSRLEQVQAESIKDPLTGLFNRRGFEQAVAHLLERGEGLQGSVLLLADVDNFKRVNDSHGHLLGDQVLCVVADVLRARTKGSDIATRLGGDEFAVLLPSTPLQGALTLAEQIRVALSRRRWTRADSNVSVENVTLTIGIAHSAAPEALDGLLKRADAALYEGKRAGRNRVFCA